MVGRLFVAVGLPSEARSMLAAALESWNGGDPLPGKVVPAANWHFTLRFLGPTPRVRYERLVAELDQADLGPRFAVTLHGLGAFPNPRRARVLWLGVAEGGGELGRLAEVVEEAVVASGGVGEDRPFRAHLTLSRFRPDRDVRYLLERDPPPRVRFVAEEVVVYRSHLGSGGARYETLEVFPLG